MFQKPTVDDAKLILELYDLRREAEMRKARHWWAAEFFPQSADEFLQSMWSGTQESGWQRQVISYWGLAASFVLRDLLHEDLFLEPSFSGEMFLILAKVQPFLPELREKLGDVQLFRNVEEVAMRTEVGRNRLQLLTKRVEVMRQRKLQQKTT
ncbi:MAG TPA: hypothetical protein VI386_11985 [Candidatus Sulfotelmatobacter sp.]